MRIAIISDLDAWAWAGCEELWASLAVAARRAGHDVDIFLNRTKAPDAKIRPLEQAGARIHFPVQWAGVSEKARALSWKLGWALDSSVLRFGPLARLAPDILFINIGDPTPTALFLHQLNAANVLRTRYFVACHNGYLHREPLSERERLGVARFYKGACCSFFVADRTRREVEHLIGERIEPVRIVRNPVNIEDFSPVPAPPGPSLGIAVVGRLAINSKGQDILVAALGAPEWARRDWTISIYGDGPHRSHLEVLARHYGVLDRMRFPGYAGDVRAIWADNHILAMPSRNESAPLALVEAMLCGRPSVVNDVGGVCEWVSEPETAFISQGSSIESFRSAMERAWQARATWPDMGARAHQRAFELIDHDPGGSLLNVLLEFESGTQGPLMSKAAASH